MNKLFDHFMNGLVTDIAKGTRIKKQLKLIKTASNKHLDNRPVVDVQKNNTNNSETSHFNTNETLSINKANITNATATTIVKNEKKVENNNKTLVTDN